MNQNQSNTICPLCKKVVDKLTKDHIVPISFTKLVGMTELNMRTFMRTKYQMICLECNQKKGNRIEWSNVDVRNYMHTLAIRILNKLEKTKPK